MAKHRRVRDDDRAVRHRKPLVALIGIGIAVSAIAGNAIGAPSPALSTTNVTFVPLNPTFKVFSAKAFSANLKFSAVVIGGATKVPTNATTVQLQVKASGKSAGSMTFYPAGNPSGGSGQSLSWTAGGSDTEVIEENVGTMNQLTFVNGATPATATASILGYSTQVTAGDISPADGSAGQVLTNTGTGASWQTTGQAYVNDVPTSQPITATGTTIATLPVPAGSYLVTSSASFGSGSADFAQCYLLSPVGTTIDSAFTGWSSAAPFSEVVNQGVLSTAGGFLSLLCRDAGAGATANYTHLIATQVTMGHGSVTSAATKATTGMQIH